MRKTTLISLLAVFFVLLSTTVFGQTLEGVAEQAQLNADHLWVLFSAAIVFLMQAGFCLFEVGAVRERSIESVAMKNIIDTVMSTLGYFIVGFGFMYGLSSNGWIGTNLFFLNGIDAAGGNPLGMSFFLFQLAFAATAATIISGAVAERTAFMSYVICSLVVGLFIYPIFGHWVWGNFFFASNEPWLASLGFLDFAGSTVVHSVGGWVALVAMWMLGPRIGRFDAKGKLKEMPSYSIGMVGVGLFVLWFGWWGFNGGSTLALTNSVPTIIANTVIASCVAGILAFLHSKYVQGGANLNEKFVGGILGGLVAVTACCDVITPMGALVVGAVAGVWHNLMWDFIMKKLKLDDPVGAVPVHLGCGILGTLFVALIGGAPVLGVGTFPIVEQLGIQIVGIVAAAIWTVGTSIILFKILKATVGLRVSPSEEKEGIKMSNA